ncbi:MAG: imidazole glycerol phosphate synthase subunit HisH [Bacteroidia bacterium]|nr:imidazole glycerol phosphate synthase subunit HisH [Bacteroidia bacterium]
MKLALVQYNAGNITSVTYALERLGVSPVLTDDPEVLRTADKVIFPGVGEASTAMAYLRARGLDQVITHLKQPVLGICLGLQLLCESSAENDTLCLGVFPHKVVRFPDADLKVPHMGWNNLTHLRGPLGADLGEHPYMYFVHSYYAETGPYTTAMTTYGPTFSAMLQKDNFFATQFHPEKSSTPGAQLLRNFLAL